MLKCKLFNILKILPKLHVTLLDITATVEGSRTLSLRNLENGSVTLTIDKGDCTLHNIKVIINYLFSRNAYYNLYYCLQ